MNRKVIIFSPLPPKENGIADYVYEQLPYHARDYDVIVVIDNADPEPNRVPAGVTVIRLEEYSRHRRVLGRLPHVYHVGNNPDHGYMTPVLMNTPGVVVIHDLGLHHLIDTQTLVRGNKAGYAWSLWQQYGRTGKLLGEQFLKFGWKGEVMPQELRLNGAFIDAAAHIIVHSEYSATRIRLEAPGKPVSVIPHHLSPKSRHFNRARRPEYRRELGLPDDGLLITSLGFISRPKQIPAILEALAALKAEGLRFTYVLAGKCRPEEYDVFRDIEQLGLQDEVIVTGYLDDDAFFKHVAAADVILNLRYPTGGETSGTLTRALGLGRCCVVVNVGPFAEIPHACAVRLDWGESFSSDLRSAIRRLAADSDERKRYELAARDWVGRYQAITRTVRAYNEVIASLPQDLEPVSETMGVLGTRQARFLPKPATERFMAGNAESLRDAVDQGAGQLWWRESLLPIGDDEKRVGLAAECDEPRVVLCDLNGYQNQRIDAIDIDPLTAAGLEPSQRHRFDCILVVLPMSLWAKDPVLPLAQLNWRLRFGGDAVVSLHFDLDRPGPVDELAVTRAAWCEYIEAAGFAVIEYFEAPRDISFSAFSGASVEWAWRLRKMSERIDRFPHPYYHNSGVRHVLLNSSARLPLALPEADTQPSREVCHAS